MACTLTLTILRISGPTVAGGWGEIAYRIGGAADAFQFGTIDRVSDGANVNIVEPGGNGDYTAPIPANGIGVELHFMVYEDAVVTASTCSAEATFTVPAFVSPADPSLTQPTPWQPVGGVLPNPILLPIEATLLDAAGQPRVGLHVEVELWRPAALVAFASFRGTVRTAAQSVDAAPYLRPQLVALLRYAALASQPLIDPDACLAYTYRYRVVDRVGAEAWMVRAGVRYAGLAALAGPADDLTPYVADGSGQVASIFPGGEGCQFVGCPLEASVLLPPAGASPRYAELRYVDATGHAVEIRSFGLAPALPAGMLRIPLPNDPPLCATAVEVSVRDDNRAFVGTCGHVVPVPPASTSGLYSDPLYGIF